MEKVISTSPIYMNLIYSNFIPPILWVHHLWVFQYFGEVFPNQNIEFNTILDMENHFWLFYDWIRSKYDRGCIYRGSVYHFSYRRNVCMVESDSLNHKVQGVKTKLFHSFAQCLMKIGIYWDKRNIFKQATPEELSSDIMPHMRKVSTQKVDNEAKIIICPWCGGQVV